MEDVAGLGVVKGIDPVAKLFSDLFRGQKRGGHAQCIAYSYPVNEMCIRDRVGGTGLGLSIAKHIANRYGGTVEIQSAEGRGTTLTVTLRR